MQTVGVEAQAELSRFFVIAHERSMRGALTPMPSGLVDEHWHSLLEEENAYRQFCMEQVGIIVKHVPNTGFGELPWVADYHAAFGQLPSTWFADASGKVDQVAYERYLQSGAVVTSWDCAPQEGSATGN